MISLFAFIVTLGIVVDDAIIIGEGIYTKRQEGLGPIDAAVQGAKELGTPVIFAILTNMIAFAPLLFVPGASGKVQSHPTGSHCGLILSLVESLFILPAHLAHIDDPKGTGFRLDRSKAKTLRHGLEAFVERSYQPFVRRLLKHRYLTLITSVGFLIITIGVIAGGVIKFTFFRKLRVTEYQPASSFLMGPTLNKPTHLLSA